MEGSGTSVAVTVTRPDSQTDSKVGSFKFVGEPFFAAEAAVLA
jgi:hypothetical protein